ncbi:MAG: hypothetical protein QF654_14510 [Alphaproteobacteria bacterium]|jgi:hypothetical protein|nr:hypothetical protein [Alphaproteobacteria bacterium]|tara:strand:+ start:154 stop:285 length:132 start_codon:yes stop_codon:yes gene_type:complete
MCSNLEKEKYLRLLVEEVRQAMAAPRRKPGLGWLWALIGKRAA